MSKCPPFHLQTGPKNLELHANKTTNNDDTISSIIKSLTNITRLKFQHLLHYIIFHFQINKT